MGTERVRARLEEGDSRERRRIMFRMRTKFLDWIEFLFFSWICFFFRDVKEKWFKPGVKYKNIHAQ